MDCQVTILMLTVIQNRYPAWTVIRYTAWTAFQGYLLASLGQLLRRVSRLGEVADQEGGLRHGVSFTILHHQVVPEIKEYTVYINASWMVSVMAYPFPYFTTSLSLSSKSTQCTYITFW